MNEQCETCRIINSDSNDVIVTKTKFWRVALQANQAYLGQSFVTLLTHKSSLSELSNEEWQDFEVLVSNMERAIKEAFGATHFNWSCLMNEAYRVSDPSPHVHWHVFPRYSKAVEFEGVVFEDVEFGQHYINRQFKVGQDMLGAIGLKLQEELRNCS
jgi:diadenosine tetraphosphate (Ap4A) HIT family hydrolase